MDTKRALKWCLRNCYHFIFIAICAYYAGIIETIDGQSVPFIQRILCFVCVLAFFEFAAYLSKKKFSRSNLKFYLEEKAYLRKQKENAGDKDAANAED